MEGHQNSGIRAPITPVPLEASASSQEDRYIGIIHALCPLSFLLFFLIHNMFILSYSRILNDKFILQDKTFHEQSRESSHLDIFCTGMKFIFSDL